MHLLGIAATGVRGQQTAMDILGNNIANVNTIGFKAKHLSFAETLDQEVPSLKTRVQPGEYGYGVGSMKIGVGVLSNATGTDFHQGSVKLTDRPFDLVIEGAGFFQIRTQNGEIAYTRAGALNVDTEGWVTDPEGNYLVTDAWIPGYVNDVAVTKNGDIIGTVDGENVVFGQIFLAAFQNAEGLRNIGSNLFAATENSGEPWLGLPGSAVGSPEQVLGNLRSGALEMSNVSLAQEMTDMIQIQRAYQLNSRMITNGDQMWGIANTIRR